MTARLIGGPGHGREVPVAGTHAIGFPTYWRPNHHYRSYRYDWHYCGDAMVGIFSGSVNCC